MFVRLAGKMMMMMMRRGGNDEKMHCIGSLVMPPSANLVNALISHQQHSTAAVVRLRWWQYIENDGHADDFFLLSLKYKIGSPHQ